MPRLIDANERTRAVLDGAQRIMAAKGPGGLTLRAIAAEVRISLGSLTSHYDNRTRLLHLLSQLAARSWVLDLAERARRLGPEGFLPITADDVVDTRVWLSWCELARSTPELSGTVHDVRVEERALLAEALRGKPGSPQPGWDDLDLALAVVHGLRQAACAPVDPIPTGRAAALLMTYLRGHGNCADDRAGEGAA